MTFDVDVELLRRDVQDALELQAYQRIMESLISVQREDYDEDGNRVNAVQDRAFVTEVEAQDPNVSENEIAFKSDSSMIKFKRDKTVLVSKSGNGKAKPRKAKVSRSSRATQNLSFSIDRLECDSDDMAHHCHSDLDYDEPDPYFEYNKCNQFEYVEKKLQGKLEEFIPIDLNDNDFMLQSRHKI